MWIATVLLRYRGRIYRKGDVVPADDPRQRRSFERLGRIVWVEAPEPDEAEDEAPVDPPTPSPDDEPPTGETGDDVPSLGWTRAALDAYATDHGLDTTDKATYPNKQAVLDAIEAALTAPDEGDNG